MHGHRYKSGEIWNVGSKVWLTTCASLFGNHVIIAVLVEEISEPEGVLVTHYGWEYTHKPGTLTMIYPRATSERNKPWMLLDMCFPYGIEAAIKRGEGQMLALRITEEIP
jgi:hypothetical protein